MTNEILLGIISIAVSIISIAVVGVVVLRYGRDRRVKSIGWVQGLMIVGLILLGLQGLLLLLLALVGFAELRAGVQSGVQHLGPAAATVVQDLVAPAATVLLLAFLAWKRPIEGGVALLIVGLTTLPTLAESYYMMPMCIMMMAAPQLVSGGLFLAGGLGAWVISRRKQDRGN
jgi:hypothetical protein